MRRGVLAAVVALVVLAGTAQAAGPPVRWSWDGQRWRSSGPPPSCPKPLTLTTPVDLSKATGVLWPGQVRGRDYKPHGGFRFDGRRTTDVVVKAPLAAELTTAARYVEQGEVQYLLVFTNPCGISYRFDHLLTLSPRFAAVAAKLPPARPDDSRTTMVNPPVPVKAGEVVATAVGFARTQNVSVDFGVYDLRVRNGRPVRGNPETAAHAVCWFGLLPPADAARVRALPPADAQAGRMSDYCR